MISESPKVNPSILSRSEEFQKRFYYKKGFFIVLGLKKVSYFSLN